MNIVSKWILFVIIYSLIFFLWGRFGYRGISDFKNSVIQPALDTLVLTGVPAILMKIHIIPNDTFVFFITSIVTIYATQTGRFLKGRAVVAFFVTIIFIILIRFIILVYVF